MKNFFIAILTILLMVGSTHAGLNDRHSKIDLTRDEQIQAPEITTPTTTPPPNKTWLYLKTDLDGNQVWYYMDEDGDETPFVGNWRDLQLPLGSGIYNSAPLEGSSDYNVYLTEDNLMPAVVLTAPSTLGAGETSTEAEWKHSFRVPETYGVDGKFVVWADTGAPKADPDDPSNSETMTQNEIELEFLTHSQAEAIQANDQLTLAIFQSSDAEIDFNLYINKMGVTYSEVTYAETSLNYAAVPIPNPGADARAKLRNVVFRYR